MFRFGIDSIVAPDGNGAGLPLGPEAALADAAAELAVDATPDDEEADAEVDVVSEGLLLQAKGANSRAARMVRRAGIIMSFLRSTRGDGSVWTHRA
jgi:hypothetical protein